MSSFLTDLSVRVIWKKNSVSRLGTVATMCDVHRQGFEILQGCYFRLQSDKGGVFSSDVDIERFFIESIVRIVPEHSFGE